MALKIKKKQLVLLADMITKESQVFKLLKRTDIGLKKVK